MTVLYAKSHRMRTGHLTGWYDLLASDTRDAAGRVGLKLTKPMAPTERRRTGLEREGAGRGVRAREGRSRLCRVAIVGGCQRAVRLAADHEALLERGQQHAQLLALLVVKGSE